MQHQTERSEIHWCSTPTDQMQSQGQMTMNKTPEWGPDVEVGPEEFSKSIRVQN